MVNPSKNKSIIFFSIFLYLSLFLSFYLNLDSAGGAFSDFQMRTHVIDKFNKNFLETFLNYDIEPDRHSPIILIYFSIFRKLNFEFDTIRLLHINILPICVFVFYKILKLFFHKNDKSLLLLFSLILFISPTMRSLSICPDSRIYGFLFFLISIFYYIKFQNKKKFRHVIYNNFFLIISSYLSPNFSVFALFYFANFFKYYNFSIEIFLIVLLNFILIIPILYYLFWLDVFFLSIPAIGNVPTLTRLNLSNKILIISSLIFFYFIPFLFTKKIFDSFKQKIFNLNNLLVCFVIFITLISLLLLQIIYEILALNSCKHYLYL